VLALLRCSAPDFVILAPRPDQRLHRLDVAGFRAGVRVRLLPLRLQVPSDSARVIRPYPRPAHRPGNVAVPEHLVVTAEFVALVGSVGGALLIFKAQDTEVSYIQI
jgi:hypothetical protein